MRGKYLIALLIVLLPFMVCIPRVYAEEQEDYFQKYEEDEYTRECKKKQRQKEANGNYKCPIFGDPDDDGKGANDTDCDGLPSTANLMQSIFTFIRFFGPALAIILSIVEFVKAAAAQDADALARAGKKTGWRIGLAILLFFIPVIINVAFSWFGWYGTCGIS